MKDSLTERFMTLAHYLTSKYQLPPEEWNELKELGYDICLSEFDRDSADYFFTEPVNFDMEPVEKKENN